MVWVKNCKETGCSIYEHPKSLTHSRVVHFDLKKQKKCKIDPTRTTRLVYHHRLGFKILEIMSIRPSSHVRGKFTILSIKTKINKEISE